MGKVMVVEDILGFWLIVSTSEKPQYANELTADLDYISLRWSAHALVWEEASVEDDSRDQQNRGGRRLVRDRDNRCNLRQSSLDWPARGDSSLVGDDPWVRLDHHLENRFGG